MIDLSQKLLTLRSEPNLPPSPRSSNYSTISIMKNFLKSNLLTIALLAAILFLIWKNYNKENKIDNLDQNLMAINDSIRVTNQNGKKMYNKYNILLDNMKDLKKYDKELFDSLEKNFKGELKNIKSVTNIENHYSDTTIKKAPSFVQKLDSNKYRITWEYTNKDSTRIIEGHTDVDINATGTYNKEDSVLHISFHDSKPDSTQITKDVLKTSFMVGTRKRNGYEEIFVIPNNNNIRITGLKGARIDRKERRFGIGPQIGGGYNVITNEFQPYIGIGVSWDIIKF